MYCVVSIHNWQVSLKLPKCEEFSHSDHFLHILKGNCLLL